ncbi:MAG: NADH-quinone oxidoreductase subunit C [Candidatus Omnitrophica bacterium]|nr:NADH-quinone oxidoreductase subunit C [Candidatus Omnitrophota bacterium]
MLTDVIKSRFPNIVTQACVDRVDNFIVIKREGIKDIASALRDDPQFDFNLLMDLFGVDYLHWEEKALRFEVIYNLYSLRKKHRLFIKAPVPEEDPSIDSVALVWPAADWYEREAWDMFGVRFKGHPNLKRILMYEEFQGHPLRKDYPYNFRQPLVGPKN